MLTPETKEQWVTKEPKEPLDLKDQPVTTEPMANLGLKATPDQQDRMDQMVLQVTKVHQDKMEDLVNKSTCNENFALVLIKCSNKYKKIKQTNSRKKCLWCSIFR
jgi:hypothetical protein